MLLPREGRYGNAIQALGSQGVTETSNSKAFEELLSRHPFHPSSVVSVDPKPAVVVDESAVLSCLKAFSQRNKSGLIKTTCLTSF